MELLDQMTQQSRINFNKQEPVDLVKRKTNEETKIQARETILGSEASSRPRTLRRRMNHIIDSDSEDDELGMVTMDLLTRNKTQRGRPRKNVIEDEECDSISDNDDFWDKELCALAQRTALPNGVKANRLQMPDDAPFETSDLGFTSSFSDVPIGRLQYSASHEDAASASNIERCTHEPSIFPDVEIKQIDTAFATADIGEQADIVHPDPIIESESELVQASRQDLNDKAHLNPCLVHKDKNAVSRSSSLIELDDNKNGASTSTTSAVRKQIGRQVSTLGHETCERFSEAGRKKLGNEMATRSVNRDSRAILNDRDSDTSMEDTVQQCSDTSKIAERSLTKEIPVAMRDSTDRSPTTTATSSDDSESSVNSHAEGGTNHDTKLKVAEEDPNSDDNDSSFSKKSEKSSSKEIVVASSSGNKLRRGSGEAESNSSFSSSECDESDSSEQEPHSASTKVKEAESTPLEQALTIGKLKKNDPEKTRKFKPKAPLKRKVNSNAGPTIVSSANIGRTNQTKLLGAMSSSKRLWPLLDDFYMHILRLNPLSFKSRDNRSNFMHDRMQHFRKYVKIPNQIRSIGEYKSFFLPLLLEEALMSIVSKDAPRQTKSCLYSFLTTTTSTESQRKYCGVSNVVNHPSTQLCVLTFRVVQPQEFSLNTGDLLAVSATETQNPELRRLNLMGIVASSSSFVSGRSSKEVFVVCSKRVLHDPNFQFLANDDMLDYAVVNQTRWRMQIVGNVTSSTREHQALLSLDFIKHRLLDLIVDAKFKTPKNKHQRPRANAGTANFPPKLHTVLKQTYNYSQLQAIEAAVHADPLVLIQGPPGTGKSHSIRGIVSAILAGVEFRGTTAPKKIKIGASFSSKSGSQSTIEGKHLRVLVCAPSNSVVDAIALRLVEQGLVDERGCTYTPRIIRVGRPEAISSRVNDLVLENVVSKAMKTKQFSSFRLARQEVLKNTQVVCATLNGAGSLTMCDFDHSFDTVIIDEAAQCVEPSALIPLKFQPRRFIMIGDHKQLPATVLCRRLLKLQYDRSLFERLAENGTAVHLLNEQYRMHTSICSFASKEFYDSGLKSSKEIQSRSLNKNTVPYHSSRFFDSCLFYNLDEGTEVRQSGSTSIHNMDEIEFILLLIKQLVAKYPNYNFHGKIGIITPYKQQMREIHREIKHQLPRWLSRSIEVNSIDGFQGREKDIIIFSCVRGQRGKGHGVSNRIGFVADKRRLNVAITRARHALWLIGNAPILRSDPVWKRLIENLERRHRLIPGSKFVDFCEGRG